MKPVLLALLIGIAGLGIYEFSVLGSRIHRGTRIAKASRPFQLASPGAARRILVVGDSTGVGTGAARPEESVAGRIAEEFPGVEVVNLAGNGAKASDVVAQLQSVARAGFDIVLVQVGGNDILGFTDLGELRDAIRQALGKAGEKGRSVIFISTGNVGLAPAFFPPISWAYTAQTRKARSIFMDASRVLGVEYVDLFRERRDSIFATDPDRYYAPDYLHPSSEGYRVWYEELKRQTGMAAILGTRPGNPAMR